MEAKGKGQMAKKYRFAPFVFCLGPFTLNSYY